MKSYRTPQQMLAHWNETKPDFKYLHQPRSKGQVDTFTWSEVYKKCLSIAGFLQEQGIKAGDRVAILSKNCAEWFIADWAISIAGAISVPIYPTANAKTVQFVLEHSESKAIFCGKLDDWKSQEPGIEQSISRISMNFETMECHHDWELACKHAPIAAAHKPELDDTWSIIYTSGSTGQPKGVVVTYQAYCYACETNASYIGFSDEDRIMSYLPLAHITERAVVQGSSLYCSTKVYFAESLQTFTEDLSRAKASLFFSVPRLWNKFQSGVHAKLPPKTLKLLLAIPFINNLIAKRIRVALGLSDAHTIASGSAPISPSILKWYQKLGINICEGWGMTETCGFSCANFPYDASKVGTIGTPPPGTDIRISSSGEIEIKSPGLFKEYYLNPELTAECKTDDGYFKTGDKGVWDEKARAFVITGRVKELFKTEKGKYVAPVPLEAKLSMNPLLEQVCVMGAGLANPFAVIQLSEMSQEMSHSDIKVSLETTLNTVNMTLESHEKISHIYITDGEWTIENDLLTPTLKIKRPELEKKYHDKFDFIAHAKAQILFESDM